MTKTSYLLFELFSRYKRIWIELRALEGVVAVWRANPQIGMRPQATLPAFRGPANDLFLQIENAVLQQRDLSGPLEAFLEREERIRYEEYSCKDLSTSISKSTEFPMGSAS